MKLSSKYFGVYKVLQLIRKVTNRLELPPNAKIYDVFHVSLLNKFHGSEVPSNETIHYLWEYEEKQAETILERRMIKRHNRAVS